MDISPIPEYETCCGMETVEFKPQLPDGSTRYIYIPNSFTPNEDGVNDLFHPVFNDDISHFEYMVITQEVMDDTSSPLVYQVEFITRENIRETAWNGMDSNGKKIKGAFSYTVYAGTKDKKAFLVQGEACAIACDEDAAYFKDKDNCFFSEQVDEMGILDIDKVAGEGDCFDM